MRRILLLILMAAAPCWSGDVELEWIGHAAFSVKSQLGAKVVIDPYDSNRWVGYRFPFEAADADALLITHAHYDHDASYYFPSATPVMRRPGEYRLHDIRIQGFQGRHAGDHAESFGNRNTVWVLETGGVRILHTGDNQALSDDLLHSIGGVDARIPIPDRLRRRQGDVPVVPGSPCDERATWRARLDPDALRGVWTLAGRLQHGRDRSVARRAAARKAGRDLVALPASGPIACIT